MRLERQTRLDQFASLGPRISLIMPVHDTPADILEVAIESVLRQTYPHWELCICDDASQSPATLAVLQRYRGLDWRVRIHRSSQHLDISGASNKALEFSTGEFIGLLDHDDALEPDALSHVVDAIHRDPVADLVYTDEDKLDEADSCVEAAIKPDFSIDYLYSVMYVLHFVVVRRSLILELGGFRSRFDGAQDYDLALRAAPRARKVLHVRKVLYHWRKSPGSAAAAFDAKPVGLRNARAAVEEAVKRATPDAVVAGGLLPGTHHVRWPVPADERISLVIMTNASRRDVPGRGEIVLLDNFLRSLESTSDLRRCDLIIVANAELPPPSELLAKKLGAKVRRFAFEGRFNLSEKANFSVAQAHNQAVLLLNDDLEVVSRGWIEEMHGQLNRPEVGAVGARLDFPDGTLQHAGIALGRPPGDVAHVFHHMRAEDAYAGWPLLVRNYSAVTGAVLGFRRDVWRRVGGYDPLLELYFNDVDFCLKVRALDLNVVYTPFAHLIHFEGSTLAADPDRMARRETERRIFAERWPGLLADDPFWPPSLPRDDVHLDRSFALHPSKP